MTTKAEAKRMSVSLLAEDLGRFELKVVEGLTALCARVEALERRSGEDASALAVMVKRQIRREQQRNRKG